MPCSLYGCPDVNEIDLEGHLGAGMIASINVRIRKVEVAERLSGLPCAEAERILPLLYGVCTKAHGAAAAAALAAARSEPRPCVISSEVLREAVRELQLSVFTGPLRSFVRQIRDPAELRAPIESALGVPAAQWLRLETLQGWSASADSPLAREFQRRRALPEPTAVSNLLPVLDAAASLELASEQLTCYPQWREHPAETGSVSREWHHELSQEWVARPLLHRWVTRLIELVRYSSTDSTSLLGRVCAVAGPTPGHGRATVETARGLLIHDVLTDRGKVVRYRLVAPTDWNFHPHGTVERWLEGAPADSPEMALAWLRRVCEALDPCMECRIAVALARKIEQGTPRR